MKTIDFGDKVYVTIGRWQLKKPLVGIIITTPDKQNRISEYDQEQTQSTAKNTKALIKRNFIYLHPRNK